MSRVHVTLVPGFFGFANLGDLTYFGHVHAFLRAAYAARGYEPVLHVVRTYPTASLVRRAVRLLDTLVAGAADDAPIHLVGHSSGGLDVRLLTAPGVELPTGVDVARLVANSELLDELFGRLLEDFSVGRRRRCGRSCATSSMTRR